jgi:Phosphodiester glycosidase
MRANHYYLLLRMKMYLFPMLAVIAFAECTSIITPPRIVQHPASTSRSDINVTSLSDIQGIYRSYVAISNAAFSIRIPEHGLQRASQQAAGCTVVTNGGPFQYNGEPVGPVIIEGSIVQNDFLSDFVGFGRSFNNEWVLGTLKDASEVEDLKIQNFLGGFNWLVYNGSIAVQDSNPTGAERSPRTMIGVTLDGRLIVAVVDGCEKW